MSDDKHIFTSTGGRRFVAVIGCGFVTSLLVYFGKISSQTYENVIIWTVGTFVAGNTLQRFSGTNIKDLIKSKKPADEGDQQ